MKVFIKGLWASLCIGAELLKDWFSNLPSIRQSALIGVVAIVLLVGFVTCARAEAGPDSNYGIIVYPEGVSMACYVEDGTPDVGEIYLCLLMKQAAPNAWMVNGTSVYCATKGDVRPDGKPAYNCGAYDKIKEFITSGAI